MSRIGKCPIDIPVGVTIDCKDALVTVKGKLGVLTLNLTEGIDIVQNNGVLQLVRPSEIKKHKALHGTYRAIVSNMVKGVAEGFEKRMELVGVGYRAAISGQILDMSLGFSHTIQLLLPQEVQAEVIIEKGKNPIIVLKSFDYQLLGMVSAKIRSLRKPEPYKGKGVRYVDEFIRRKDVKSTK